MIKRIQRVWKTTGKTKSFGILILMYLVIGIMGLLISNFVGSVTESVISQEFSQAIRYMMALVIVSVVYVVFFIVSNRFVTKTTQSMRRILKKFTIVSILESSNDFRSKQEQGDIIGRLNSDVSSVVTAATMSATFLKSVLILLIYMVGLALIDYRVLLLFLLPFPIIFLLQAIASSISVKLILPWKEAMGTTNSLTQDVLNNRTTIKVFQLENKVDVWVNSALNNIVSTGAKGISVLYAIQIPTMIIAMSSLFLIGALGCYWISIGKMNISELVSAITIVQMSNDEFNNALNNLQNIPHLMASSERIFPLWDSPKEQFDSYKGVNDLETVIEFRNVNYGYESEDGSKVKVLENVSFVISNLDNVGIMGPSGSGKSTILKLILGVIVPDSGEVLFRNVPVQKWDKETLRQEFACVTQNTYLLNRSIMENLRVTKSNASESELMDVIEKVQLGAVVKTSHDLRKVVGERGSLLSGGQRQRLAIARALLKESSVLLFDEATSALDVETEQAINEMMNQDFGNTQIRVAHRLSTIKACNKIIVLNHGRIENIADHQNLMLISPTYKTMYQQQMEGLQ